MSVYGWRYRYHILFVQEANWCAIALTLNRGSHGRLREGRDPQGPDLQRSAHIAVCVRCPPSPWNQDSWNYEGSDFRSLVYIAVYCRCPPNPPGCSRSRGRCSTPFLPNFPLFLPCSSLEPIHEQIPRIFSLGAAFWSWYTKGTRSGGLDHGFSH